MDSSTELLIPQAPLTDLPAPDDPALAGMAAALEAGGQCAEVFDRDWRYVYMTREMRRAVAAPGGDAGVPLGAHAFGSEALRARRGWRSGLTELRHVRPYFAALGGWLVADTPGGRDALRELVDPGLRDLVDELAPVDGPALTHTGAAAGLRGNEVRGQATALRIHAARGEIAGTAVIFKPDGSMAVLAQAAGDGDADHFEQMQRVARAARRPGAILFADLEASSALARRMSSESYFRLARRLVVAADRCVIDAGGLVGRHVGDGVSATFLAETAGSEAAAARACVGAVRALRDSVADVAVRSGVDPGDVVLRFGLHWGAEVHVGQILTRGRAEVTAFGVEVNEAARIEACATGGRALASRALVERLDPRDAPALGIDPARVAFVPLASLPTATDKARRDAPAVAVCEL